MLLRNIEALEIRPEEIDYLFITHGHYNHTGELKVFFEARGKRIMVIAHPGIFLRRIALNPHRRKTRNSIHSRGTGRTRGGVHPQ